MESNKAHELISYGAFVRQKRHESNLTEEVLAERIGMSDREIRNIESGITVPKLDTVMKIGEALGMDLGDLQALSVTKDPV